MPEYPVCVSCLHVRGVENEQRQVGWAAVFLSGDSGKVCCQDSQVTQAEKGEAEPPSSQLA